MVPGAGLLGETLRTYSLPFLRNAFSSSFKTPLDVFLYSLCLFPAFFRITILKILDKPGASAVTFLSPHGENRHAFAPSILSRESQRYNRDFRSNNAVKHLRSFDIYIYIPRRYTSKYPDNCLRMKLNPPSLPFPAMSRRGARRNRFFLSSSFFSRRGWSRM